MSAPTVEVSDAVVDTQWDDFAATCPGGHHVQSSAWGQIKAILGWRAVRVVARRDGVVVAGCQLLVRRFGPAGALAYAPRGPLARVQDQEAMSAVLDTLDGLAREERIRLLKVQPPIEREDLEFELRRRGFRPSAQEATPGATVLVDLAAGEDRVLAGFRSSARSNVRKAERRGVRIRLGGEPDLGTFAELVDHTARRQGFAPYPPDYYARMWELFAATGHTGLLLAEHEGKALSALLVIGFGDAAVYKMGGWAGERSGVHPNELLHLHAMRWARASGYRFYDLEGIPVVVGRALLAGQDPADAHRGTARFKLGLGGEVRLFPRPHDRGRPRILGTVVRRAAPRLQAVAHRATGRVPVGRD